MKIKYYFILTIWYLKQIIAFLTGISIAHFNENYFFKFLTIIGIIHAIWFIRVLYFEFKYQKYPKHLENAITFKEYLIFNKRKKQLSLK